MAFLRKILSDKGKNFESSLIAGICEMTKTKKKHADNSL